MAIELMTFDNGGISLEFDTADYTEVRHRLLTRFGPYSFEQGIDFALVSVAGEELILNYEWDDPCLLATTPRGKDMLRALADPVAVAAE